MTLWTDQDEASGGMIGGIGSWPTTLAPRRRARSGPMSLCVAALGLMLASLLYGCATPEVVEDPESAEVAEAVEEMLKPPPPLSENLPSLVGPIVVEAMEYPWSAIGRVNTGGRGFCSGYLVGPRQVLTNARCLYYAVEGRWWSAGEIHFVAGYQRDRVLIHSGVESYAIAPGFGLVPGETLAELANPWALLTLEDPIGHRAGWLGLHTLDDRTPGRSARDGPVLLPAGYRRGQAHVITVNFGCGLDGATRIRSGLDGACQGSVGELALPILVFALDGFRVVGDHSGTGARRAQAGSLERSLRAATGRATGSRPPTRGGPAAAVPLKTIDRFLLYLGYLRGPPDAVTPEARRSAIEDFQWRARLPVTGDATVALLGRLIRTFRAPLHISLR